MTCLGAAEPGHSGAAGSGWWSMATKPYRALAADANPGAPKGNRNAHKHGGRSAATMAVARYLRQMARNTRPAVKR